MQQLYATYSNSVTLVPSEWEKTAMIQSARLLGSPSVSQFYGMPDADSQSATAVLQHEDLQRNRDVYTLDNRTRDALAKTNTRIAKENLKHYKEMGKIRAQLTALSPWHPRAAELQKKLRALEAKIKAPVDFQNMTAQLQAIVDSAMPEPKKKEAIDKIRQDTGLYKKEMRTLFTGRMKKIYQESAQRLEQQGGILLNQASAHLGAMTRFYGPNSTQAHRARMDLLAIQRTLAPQLDRLKDAKSFLGKLYPKPVHRGWFSKLKGAVKKVGHVVKNAVQWTQKTAAYLRGVAAKMMSLARVVLPFPTPSISEHIKPVVKFFTRNT